MEMDNGVKFIRLSTGEDLVSQVLEVNTEDNQHYVLINPLKILYMTGNKPGILSISLMQWIFHRVCDVQEFTIYPTEVVTMAIPSSNLIEYYQDSVEQFEANQEKQKKNTEFGSEDPENELDLLDKIQEYLKVNNKRILH